MTRKLVTIISEAVLERRIVEDLKQLGVQGYTISDARGEGHRGRRDGSWEHNRNVRIESVCTEEIASKVLHHLADNYYANFAIITYVAEVEVLRKDKF